MKIRLPFGWFWYGDQEYGTPEVESGTIAASNPQPPASMVARLPPGVPPPLDAGQQTEQDLQPYVSPAWEALVAKAVAEAKPPETVEEKVDRLERELQAAREGHDPNWRGR